MKWVSHIAIAGSISALCNPAMVPVAVLGATAPDWLEWLIKASGQRLKHRAQTHYLAYWAGALAFALLLWDWKGILFWFSFGGLLHVLCDAFTVTGVPVGPWSDRRFHLFGGRLRTGSPAEYMVAGCIVLMCFVIGSQLQTVSGFFPFFYDWAGLYGKGVVDAYEWKINRFRFF
jgi:inner membrane protein